MHQIWCTLARRAKSSPWRGKVKASRIVKKLVKCGYRVVKKTFDSPGPRGTPLGDMAFPIGIFSGGIPGASRGRPRAPPGRLRRFQGACAAVRRRHRDLQPCAKKLARRIFHESRIKGPEIVNVRLIRRRPAAPALPNPGAAGTPRPAPARILHPASRIP